MRWPCSTCCRAFLFVGLVVRCGYIRNSKDLRNELTEDRGLDLFRPCWDIKGRRISEAEVFPGNRQRIQIDTGGWPAGMYYVRFGNATFQSIAKMVKQ